MNEHNEQYNTEEIIIQDPNKNNNFNVFGIIVAFVVGVVTAVYLGFPFFEKVAYVLGLNFSPYNKQAIIVSLNSDSRINSGEVQAVKDAIKNKFDEKYDDEVVVSQKDKKHLKIRTHEEYTEEQIKELLKTPLIEFKSSEYPTTITSKNIKKAELTTMANGSWAVSVELDKESTKKFGEMTTALVGKPLNVYHNGEVIMSPIVAEPILKGRIMISGGAGGFTQEEATEIASNIVISYLDIKFDSFSK